MTATIRTIVCLFALVLALPAAAEWTWFSPLQLVSTDSQLAWAPGQPSSAARFRASAVDDALWANLGLDLPAGVVVDSVRVCYEIVIPGGFISQVRLTRMSTPDVAPVYMDQGADLTDPGPDCVTYHAGFEPEVSGAMTVGLRFEFDDTSGIVEIGAIAVHTRPVVTAVEDEHAGRAPGASLLDQNHPNPFNPATSIAFDLPRAERVELAIYTVDGKRVRTLVDRELAAGSHELAWNGRDDAGRALPSGVYLYRLETAERNESRRMTLIR